MKKSIGICLIIMGMFNAINAQVVDIPDQHFKDRLIDHEPVIDINGDGEIQQSEAEAFTGILNVSGTVSEPGEIQDLSGIEYFFNIHTLNCEYNQISNLTLTDNIELQTLICNYNEITALDITNNVELRTLSASGNLFDSIDLSNNFNLEFIQSNFGQLNALDTGQNTLLRFLYVQGNSLNNLDLSHNPLLTGLIIDNNEIETLNTSTNNNLIFIYCRNNNLLELNLSNNYELTTLDCKNNAQLEYINIKNGSNENLILSGGSQSCNFEDLPELTTVCLDDVHSDLADFITAQAGHPVDFTNECDLGKDDIQFRPISLFPNPTRQSLYVKSSRSIDQIEVYNLIGLKVIYKEMASTQIQLDVSELKQGMYIIRFNIEPNSHVIQRFVKY